MLASPNLNNIGKKQYRENGITLDIKFRIR